MLYVLHFKVLVVTI